MNEKKLLLKLMPLLTLALLFGGSHTIVADTFQVSHQNHLFNLFEYLSCFVASESSDDQISSIDGNHELKMISPNELTSHDIRHPIWCRFHIENRFSKRTILEITDFGPFKGFQIFQGSHGLQLNLSRQNYPLVLDFPTFVLEVPPGIHQFWIRHESYIPFGLYLLVGRNVYEVSDHLSTFLNIYAVAKIIMVGLVLGFFVVVLTASIMLPYPIFFLDLGILTSLIVITISLCCHIPPEAALSEIFNLVTYDAKLGYRGSTWPPLIVAVIVYNILMLLFVIEAFDLRKKVPTICRWVFLFSTLLFVSILWSFATGFYYSRIYSNLMVVNLFNVQTILLIPLLKNNNKSDRKFAIIFLIGSASFMISSLMMINMISSLNLITATIFTLSIFYPLSVHPILILKKISKKHHDALAMDAMTQLIHHDELKMSYNPYLLPSPRRFQYEVNFQLKLYAGIKNSNYWYGYRSIPESHKMAITLFDLKKEGSVAAILKGFLMGTFYGMDFLENAHQTSPHLYRDSLLIHCTEKLLHSIEKRNYIKITKPGFILLIVDFSERIISIATNDPTLCQIEWRHGEKTQFSSQIASKTENFSFLTLPFNQITKLKLTSKNYDKIDTYSADHLSKSFVDIGQSDWKRFEIDGHAEESSCLSLKFGEKEKNAI